MNTNYRNQIQFSGLYLSKELSVLDLGKTSFEYNLEVTDTHQDKVFLNGKSIALSKPLKKETGKLFKKGFLGGLFGKPSDTVKLTASFKKTVQTLLSGLSQLTPEDIQGFTQAIKDSTTGVKVKNTTDGVTVLKLQ